MTLVCFPVPLTDCLINRNEFDIETAPLKGGGKCTEVEEAIPAYPEIVKDVARAVTAMPPTQIRTTAREAMSLTTGASPSRDDTLWSEFSESEGECGIGCIESRHPKNPSISQLGTLCDMSRKEIRANNMPGCIERHDGGARYKSLADNLLAFNELGEVVGVNIEGLDEGEGIERTLTTRQAKWHKFCRVRYDNLKLQRAQKRKESSGQEAGSGTSASSTKHTRSNTTCVDSMRNALILDNSITRYRLLLAQLSEGDMVAREAKYHKRCLTFLYNRARAVSETEKRETTYETEHNKGRDILLAFEDDIGDALAKACEYDHNNDAVHLLRAAQIVRRDMFTEGQGFNESFSEKCQENSVSTLLMTLVSMILEGPSIDSPQQRSAASLTIVQLLKYNSVKHIRKEPHGVANVRHRVKQETPLPIYVGMGGQRGSTKTPVTSKVYTDKRPYKDVGEHCEALHPQQIKLHKNKKNETATFEAVVDENTRNVTLPRNKGWGERQCGYWCAQQHSLEPKDCRAAITEVGLRVQEKLDEPESITKSVVQNTRTYSPDSYSTPAPTAPTPWLHLQVHTSPDTYSTPHPDSYSLQYTRTYTPDYSTPHLHPLTPTSHVGAYIINYRKASSHIRQSDG
ncbi:hypothetical protein Hamer_G001481 [Homarus americanus]|uniref:Uncharacterized protein n=1 Tax=Homarus americanus TaxID=6706 RepID=A0A8J5N7V4_HOMAM|nr:hypothetical protein Hamer_G001481 [Homarus americanus]